MSKEWYEVVHIFSVICSEFWENDNGEICFVFLLSWETKETNPALMFPTGISPNKPKLLDVWLMKPSFFLQRS
jgi:hypothetical protein